MLASKKVEDGNEHADDDDRPLQHGRLDATSQPAADHPTQQRSDRHDDCHSPCDFSRKQEEDRRRHVDDERDRLFQRVQPRERIVDCQPQRGKEHHPQPRAEISAVDRCQPNREPRERFKRAMRFAQPTREPCPHRVLNSKQARRQQDQKRNEVAE